MAFFEKYLSIWVALAIATGVGLGVLFPDVFDAIARLEVAQVNIVIALLIWLMIYPMMLKVNLSSLREIIQKPKGLALTLGVNWLVKPFTMAALGVLFFKVIFASIVPTHEASEIIAGMILLGVAPCTAMVFVWSHLTNGDPHYTLAQVSLNDLIMVFAFAPLAGFLLGVTDIIVPWGTLVVSALLFIVIPLSAGLFTQHVLEAPRLERLDLRLKPLSILGLLGTVVLLFGFQSETLLSRPLLVLLIAIPLLIQSYGVFALSYGMARVLKLPFNIAAPAALIGTSNFFELAVAVAISLFGLNSTAALATVVGVLIEVPVMLSLVALANRTQTWFASPTDPS